MTGWPPGFLGMPTAATKRSRTPRTVRATPAASARSTARERAAAARSRAIDRRSNDSAVLAANWHSPYASRALRSATPRIPEADTDLTAVVVLVRPTGSTADQIYAAARGLVPACRESGSVGAPRRGPGWDRRGLLLMKKAAAAEPAQSWS
jgi:hypothetical protein